MASQSNQRCCELSFSYPEEKHVRQHYSGSQTNYRKYKADLKQEFSNLCVYCRVPDTMWENSDHFGIDHYLPKSVFPSLKADYDNLFYCCNKCNRKKGVYYCEEQEPCVVNPCSMAMASHMQFSDSLVESKSKHGEFTVGLLELNEETRIEYREFLTYNYSQMTEVREELQEQHAEGQELLERYDSPESVPETLVQYMLDIERELMKTRVAINRLTGCDCSR